MKRIALPLLAALAAVSLPSGAQAQMNNPAPVLSPGSTLLTVSAEGKSTRTPDLAVFNAGVTSQGATAREALTENSNAMSRVIAALKKAGIADRDIQTSNLNINPVYSQQRQRPDGTIEPPQPKIVGYQVNNSVTVRQRNLKEFGTVIDTLVSSGANQVNGPSFTMDQPDAALDEARVEAMKKARARAELYAKAAGLRVARILSISESGGNYYPQPAMYARAAAMDVAAAPPVEAGEVTLNASVTVQFELAP